jgi:hypothetical protein
VFSARTSTEPQNSKLEHTTKGRLWSGKFLYIAMSFTISEPRNTTTTSTSLISSYRLSRMDKIYEESIVVAPIEFNDIHIRLNACFKKLHVH